MKGVKGTGTPAKVRTAYLVFKLDIDENSPATATLEVIDVVRSAEVALELVDANPDAKYHRFSMN